MLAYTALYLFFGFIMMMIIDPFLKNRYSYHIVGFFFFGTLITGVIGLICTLVK